MRWVKRIRVLEAIVDAADARLESHFVVPRWIDFAVDSP